MIAHREIDFYDLDLVIVRHDLIHVGGQISNAREVNLHDTVCPHDHNYSIDHDGISKTLHDPGICPHTLGVDLPLRRIYLTLNPIRYFHSLSTESLAQIGSVLTVSDPN